MSPNATFKATTGAGFFGYADEANELLRERGMPEILECTPHTLRRTYVSLVLAAGCDPA